MYDPFDIFDPAPPPPPPGVIYVVAVHYHQWEHWCACRGVNPHGEPGIRCLNLNDPWSFRQGIHLMPADTIIELEQFDHSLISDEAMEEYWYLQKEAQSRQVPLNIFYERTIGDGITGISVKPVMANDPWATTNRRDRA